MMTTWSHRSRAHRADPPDLEGVIGVPATEGNRIDVLRNGDEIFPAMLEAIDGAEHTIDFLTFVYWEGEIGTRVRRGARGEGSAGVRVRVLLDAWGAHPIERDTDRPDGGRGRAGPVVPSAAPVASRAR